MQVAPVGEQADDAIANHDREYPVWRHNEETDAALLQTGHHPEQFSQLLPVELFDDAGLILVNE